MPLYCAGLWEAEITTPALKSACLVMQAIAGVGLNIEQLLVDMNAPEVAQRMEQDRNDAVALKVTATPEYFVNGRPMPSFGQQQLLTLVSEALQDAY